VVSYLVSFAGYGRSVGFPRILLGAGFVPHLFGLGGNGFIFGDDSHLGRRVMVLRGGVVVAQWTRVLMWRPMK
jgi:hypothetical protein